MNIHLALVHFPVYNKCGEIVVSSVTTLDVHDISRTCRTYGVESFYLITPLETQQRLVRRIVDHWVTGHGAEYNPTRKEALVRTRVGNSLQDILNDIRERTGQDAKTVITDAKTDNVDTLSFFFSNFATDLYKNIRWYLINSFGKNICDFKHNMP